MTGRETTISEQLQRAATILETARQAVERGEYAKAAKVAQQSRDLLYVVDVELRQAEVVRLQARPERA